MYYSCKNVVSIRQKLITLALCILGVILLCAVFRMPVEKITSPLGQLHSLTDSKKGYEVFGFAPYWTMDKMRNVDFSVLTTFSYFGIPVGSDGSLDTSDVGYTTFESQQATDLFTKAHQYGTRVVLTLTQMDSGTIIQFLDNPDAQNQAISQAVSLVKSRGIDGINVDFEYIGDPGGDYQKKYSNFVDNLTEAMHQAVPASRVTVSVLATSVKDATLYNIHSLSQKSDGIFMMAYDFATLSADNAMPTSPMYGYKDGKYWYDVSTAVKDFLTQMPASKLILGVPWYAYNYVVYSPGIKAETLPYYSWKGSPIVQTYATASANSVDAQGWDSEGQVGWKAYYVASTGAWRMLFIEDKKSLGIKYEFAKKVNLAGVGIWALGFDDGKSDMWAVLQDKFGEKYADSSVENRAIQNIGN